ncbi:hypothetical protein [Brevundimonas sp.]|nr:hypothetical protein [Brevundimonas sp.]
MASVSRRTYGDAACVSGPSPNCVILEDLAQTRQKSCCGPKAA